METISERKANTLIEKDKLPRLSLILVVRNEKKFVENAINSFVQQDYPKDLLELIIVDGMSTDGTRETVEKIIDSLKKQGWKLIFSDNQKGILSTGWNIAIHASSGDMVCRIDAHSELYSNYISKGIEVLINNNDKMVAGIGGVLEHYGQSFIGNTIADLLSSKFAVGNSPFRTDKNKNPRLDSCKETDTAVYAIYYKRIFEEVGFFNENMVRNQDIEFHQRLKSRGYKLLTCPQMRIKYYVRESVKKLIKKAYSDGYWTGYSGYAYLRHKIPGYFVFYIFLTFIINLFLRNIINNEILLDFNFPLLFYILLVFLFSIKDGNGFRRFLLLFLFPIFHISYGLGTLHARIKKFLNCLS